MDLCLYGLFGIFEWVLIKRAERPKKGKGGGLADLSGSGMDDQSHGSVDLPASLNYFESALPEPSTPATACRHVDSDLKPALPVHLYTSPFTTRLFSPPKSLLSLLVFPRLSLLAALLRNYQDLLLTGRLVIYARDVRSYA